MIRVAFLCAFLILLLPVVGGESIILIEIQEKGNATWRIEQRLPLTSQEEIDDWEEFIKNEQDIEQYEKDIIDFKSRINGFIEAAENNSNRSMNASEFNISYFTTKTLSGDFGIIHYSFEWTNFSIIEPEKIRIGDIFTEGMLLSSDNVLIIKIPVGYDVVSTSPQFDNKDGTRLIWDGALFRSFSPGEPALVISKKNTSIFSWSLILFLIGLGAGASVIFWKRKEFLSLDILIYKASSILGPKMDLQDMEYEEMIEQIIAKEGGRVSQSVIVKESGLSKSKISVILADMKDKGRIIKIRKGKENIIKWNRK